MAPATVNVLDHIGLKVYAIYYLRHFRKYGKCLFTYYVNGITAILSVLNSFQSICSRVNIRFSSNFKMSSNSLFSIQCSSLIRFKVMSMALGYYINECCLMYTFEVIYISEHSLNGLLIRFKNWLNVYFFLLVTS